ncbi:MAG: AEC family transporter [Bosea sp. (in: a-proteobacteria)]
MPVLFDSLAAVFLLIATGYGLAATGFVSPTQWAGFERVTYHVLFPAVVVHTLSMAKLGSVPFLGVSGALVGGILIITALLLLARPHLVRLGVDGPSFTSVFQGAARWNTFIALALAGSLYGNLGITLMAVAIAAMIPLLNVFSVLILTRYAGSTGQSPSQILRALVTNPFIWSSVLGLLLNPVAAYLPKAVVGFADITGRASLAAGLLVVGSGLSLKALARPGLAHALAITLKLLAMPMIAFLLAKQLGVTGTALAVTVIAASVPTASGSYILARQMGGNAPLMAEITTLQTLLAFATIPVALLLLQ